MDTAEKGILWLLIQLGTTGLLCLAEPHWELKEIKRPWVLSNIRKLN